MNGHSTSSAADQHQEDVNISQWIANAIADTGTTVVYGTSPQLHGCLRLNMNEQASVDSEKIFHSFVSATT